MRYNQDKMRYTFIEVVKKYTGIDPLLIINDMKDIEFDAEGPICSDHKLMQIFSRADYENIYSEAKLYDTITKICYEFCMVVERNKNIYIN